MPQTSPSPDTFKPSAFTILLAEVGRTGRRHSHAAYAAVEVLRDGVLPGQDTASCDVRVTHISPTPGVACLVRVGDELTLPRHEVYRSDAEREYFRDLVSYYQSHTASVPGMVAMPGPRPPITAVGAPRATNAGELAVIACSAKKLDRAAPARDLYQGELFKACVAYAEARGLPWVVVSAKHGIVQPDQILEPYDARVPTRADERSAWAKARRHEIYRADAYGTDKELVLLCGADYRHAFIDIGYDITTPLAGKGIGEQKQWLKQATEAEHKRQVMQCSRDMLAKHLAGEPIADELLEPRSGDPEEPAIKTGVWYRVSDNRRIFVVRPRQSPIDPRCWTYGCIDQPSGETYDQNEFAILRKLRQPDGRIKPCGNRTDEQLASDNAAVDAYWQRQRERDEGRLDDAPPEPTPRRDTRPTVTFDANGQGMLL